MKLVTFIHIAGLAQLGILIASALVPTQLDWKNVFGALPKLHRQMYWTYGGYVVLAIIFNGVVCIIAAPDLVGGSLLGRLVCGYIAIFWGVRTCLQFVFDVKPYLKTWWLHAGYCILTALFTFFTILFAYAAGA